MPITAEARVRVAPDSGETFWPLTLENGSDLVLHEVLFPHLAGIVLGETHADDTLTYPYHAGERTRNPVEEYAGPQFFGAARNGVALQRVPTSAGHEERTVYARECPYLGSASMPWMDLSDAGQGLYLASYDDTFLVTGLRVETGGPDHPWMGFGFRKHLAIRRGERWDSRPYAVGVHDGDWHWAADRYREWAERVFHPPAAPRWLRDDPVEATAFWEAPPRERDSAAASLRVLVLAWNKSAHPQDLEIDLGGRIVHTAHSLVPGETSAPTPSGTSTIHAPFLRPALATRCVCGSRPRRCAPSSSRRRTKALHRSQLPPLTHEQMRSSSTLFCTAVHIKEARSVVDDDRQ